MPSGEVTRIGKREINWDIPLSEEDRKDLEPDLMAELNAAQEDEEAGEQRIPVRRRGPLFHIAGWLTIAAFLYLASAVYFQGDWLPPRQVLTQSEQLKQTAAIKDWQQGVVLIETLDSQGTGFNIAPDGLVVTNRHVVAGVEQVWVKFSQGLIYRGTVLARHPQVDLALVRITGQNLPRLPLASSAQMADGSKLLIIGNPLGFPFVTTPGTAAGQSVPQGWTEPVLRVRTYVQHGSSGSPVLNAQGQVVGIIFAMNEGGRDEDSGITTAFAVTVDSLRLFLTAAGL